MDIQSDWHSLFRVTLCLSIVLDNLSFGVGFRSITLEKCLRTCFRATLVSVC